MSLKVKDINNIMESLAPVNLKEGYDNVGLMVGSLDNEITNILIALDCTSKVIEEAKKRNCNFIITHHPLLFVKPETITDETLIGRKIIELIKNNISLYSSHTNLDVVKGGLNDIITELLGYDNYSIIEPNNANNTQNEEGIGRLVTLDLPCTLLQMCTNVKAALNLTSLRYIGEESKLIRKLAVVNGSGEDFYKAAYNCGADLIITGDTKYHNSSDFSEMGMAIIDAGHFETEWPAMNVFANKFKNKLISNGFFNKIIISDVNKPIYKIM
jgi:dinuclear metal center YbgI/SA1388 family protein